MKKSALLTLPEAWSEQVSSAVEMLKAHDIEVDLVWSDAGLPKDELIKRLQGKHAHMMSLDVLDRDVIERSSSLRVIAKHGIGLDNIDIIAATQRGIPVCNTPGSNCYAVADLTIGLLLAVCRKIVESNAIARQGSLTQMMGTELYGKSIGIVGFGAIGKQVAFRAAGFGMRVYAYDKYMDHAFCEKHGFNPVEFSDLIARCDFITLHLPLTSETTNLINADTIRQMKKGAVLVNVARGGVADEDACAHALFDGHLGGAAFDVYSHEPPRIEDRIFNAPNTLFTTHMAGCTKESIARSAEMAAENIIDILDGKMVPSIVNPEAFR